MFAHFLLLYRAAYSGLPREVWLLSIILLVNRSGAMVLLFLPLYLTKHLHLSPHQIGLLIGGCYGVGGIIGAVLGGRLTSRFGPIRVQIVSLLLSAPSFLLLGASWDFASTGCALLLLSVVSEMMRPASMTAATLYSPPHVHKKAMGHNRLALNLGTALGGTIGGILAGIDYQFLFFVNSCTVFCSALLTISFFGFRDHISVEQHAGVNVGFDIRSASRSPLTDGHFICFWLLNLSTAFVFFQLLGTFPKYLDEQLGINEFQLGILMAINTLIIVAAEMVILHLLGERNVLRWIALGSWLSCLGFGLLPYGAGFSFVAFTVVIWTVGEMLAMPLSALYVSQRSSVINRGRYMGMFVSSYALAMVLAPLVGLSVYNDNPQAMWHIAMAVGFVCLIGFWVLSLFQHAAPNREV